MNFDDLLKSSRLYTFHSHTQFCDGRAPMEDMARAAVASGFTHYGFSPHSPLPIPSPCNMSMDDVEPYLDEVRRIALMPDLASCRFFAGMEIDYLDSSWGPANSYFRDIPLDYRIASIHFIKTQDGEFVDIDGSFERFRKNMTERFRGDIDYVIDTFYNQTMDMIGEGCFDIIGHFDKIIQNAGPYAPGIEDGAHYASRIGEVIDRIIADHITIELNTKGRALHGRFFPADRYLSRLIEGNVTILVNSDAHRPELVNASRDEAYGIIDSLSTR